VSILKNLQNAIDHLKTHQEYPTTKQDLVETCNKLSDFSEEDKKWFEENIPEGTYNSAEEVMNALGMKQESATPAV
jgi:hypothetical protein